MAEQDIKQVMCIKWGNRYGPEYVNRIYGMVSRNITPPFRVICFTDDRTGVRPEVDCYDLPDLGCPRPTNAPGKWPKTALWNKDLFGLQGLALFVDLDVVITGNLDPFFTYGDPDDVIQTRNMIKPLERLGQSSIFRFRIGAHHYLLENFRKDPEGIAGHYQFEQRYVTQNVRGGVKFWPRNWVRHFRLDCLGPWPVRYFRAPRLPKDARVVIFPGKPDPADAILGRWSEQVSPLAPLQHLLHVFKNAHGNKWRQIKRYVKPTPWIDEHWRE